MIKVQQLTKTFGAITAVDAVSFDVRRGEIFAFLGPNGAGKTTTIKILTTMMRPTSGTVIVDGLDITRRQADIRKKIGVVFQDASLDLELTAYENMHFYAVLYGLTGRLRRARIEHLLDLFGLSGRKNEQVKRFSGGMRRRLEIARGLLHTPNILFLDEPTVGLDPQAREQLWIHVHRLNKSEDITVFMTTHYLEEAERIADTVAIIDGGQIIAQGTTDSIKQQTRTQTLDRAFVALTGSTIPA